MRFLPRSGAGLCVLTIALAARGQTAADLVKEIRAAGLEEAQCYRVRDLSLPKEDLHLYLNDGYLIFAKPVRGERWAAVFTADVEGGDGEVLLLPPFRGERQSLARFTQSPNLDEHFHAAILLFTDGSGEQLLEQAARRSARRAPEIAPVIAEQFGPTLSNIEEGFELRLVRDLLTPRASRRGLLFATLGDERLGNFDVYYDSRGAEQILAGRIAEHNGRLGYDIWTSFPARSYRQGTSQPPQPDFTAERYEIEGVLAEPDLRLKAGVRIQVKIGQDPVRVLPFDLSRALEVSSAQIDGRPAELLVRDSARDRALRADENDAFLLIASEPLEPASTHQIEFEEEGSVISTAGRDVYFVGARANWYPRAGTGLAQYELFFRYPKRLTLVSSGEIIEDRVEGEFRLTRRATSAPIRLAGFNLGDYEKVVSPAMGGAENFRVEVYGNRSLEASLQPRLRDSAVDTGAVPAPVILPGRRRYPPPVTPIPPPAPAPPDPLARLKNVAADVSSALELYSGWFGPPGLKRLTVSPIPGPFGQGFPGLIYLSTIAYLDPEARPASLRGPREQVFFSDLMQAHEVAHQWWGDLVIPAGYQDEWISEALANYSALMYLEKKKGPRALEDVLEEYRDALLKKNAAGGTVESAGPITLGYRLAASDSQDTWHQIIYDKGTWIFHMLRRRLGDDRFLQMLAELRRRYDSHPVSTADLRALVKEHLPPRVRPSTVDDFFENWVYSTGIPELKMSYSVKGAAPSVRLGGKIEQSGVDDDFSVEVPVEIQFARAPSQTIWVQVSNAGATFSSTLQQAPIRVSIPIGTVLALKK